MKLKLDVNKVFFLLTILFVAFFFYILNALTPENADDYVYKYIFKDAQIDTSSRIKSLSDIIHSQINHYQLWNGRSIVHSLAQFFTGITGKIFFNPINTIVYIIYLILLCKCGHIRFSCFSLLICHLLTFLFMPSFNVCYLMMTGSINYLWSSVAFLLFLILIESKQQKTISFSSFLLIPIGVICGWTHEGITAPLSIGILAYIILQRKNIFRKEVSFLIIGFFIGAIMCASSPGTLGRASAEQATNPSVLLMKFFSGITVLGKMRLFYILLTLLFITIKWKGVILNKWFKDNIILVGGIIGSLGLIMLSGFSSSRAGFGLELFSMVLIIRLLSQLLQAPLSSKWTYLLFFFSTILMVSITYYASKNHKEYKSLISQITKTDNYIIEFQQVKVPSLLSRFILRPIDDEGGDYDNNFWNKGFNPFISASYNRDSLIFIPSRFMYDLKKADHFKHFSDGDHLPFYAKRISSLERQKAIKSISFILREPQEREIPLYYRPFANRLDRFSAKSIDAQKYTIIKYGGERYLLVQKNQNIDWRVKNITIEYE